MKCKNFGCDQSAQTDRGYCSHCDPMFPVETQTPPLVKELQAKAERIARGEYVSIGHSLRGEATLDGDFTADQLRKIADLMDQLPKERP